MASTGSAVRPEDVHDWGRQLDEVARRIGFRRPAELRALLAKRRVAEQV